MHNAEEDGLSETETQTELAGEPKAGLPATATCSSLCVSTPTMTLVAPKGLVLVTAVSSSSAELAPAGRESGQDCERAYGQAPIRSLLIRSVDLVGRLENKPTDHKEGIAPVPLWVRPEPRRPVWDYRSPIIADNLHQRGIIG